MTTDKEIAYALSQRLEALKKEVGRVEGALRALRGSGSPASPKNSPSRATPKAHGRVWSKADREKMSRRIKLALAKKKKTKAASA